VNRHRFDADPEPTFHFDADPDPLPKLYLSWKQEKKIDFISPQCQSHCFIFLSAS
jgi:hypothetical protein